MHFEEVDMPRERNAGASKTRSENPILVIMTTISSLSYDICRTFDARVTLDCGDSPIVS